MRHFRRDSHGLYIAHVYAHIIPYLVTLGLPSEGAPAMEGAMGDLCKDAAKCPHLRIAHILAYMCLLRRGATQPPAARRDARRLPWRRGFQPRCPLNVLAHNLTIILSHCFRYLEFWSIGGLEILTRSPKLRNSQQRKQSNAEATEPPVARRDAQRLPWRRGFQPRPLPWRWSFQLRHNDAARRRISLVQPPDVATHGDAASSRVISRHD